VIRLTLPYPISTNRYWRSFAHSKTKRVVTVVSKEAQAFKEKCGWIARANGVRQPLQGDIAIGLELVPKNRICLDLDNAIKVTLDSLQGIAYENDSQIVRIAAEKCAPESVACVRVEIMRVDSQQPLELPPGETLPERPF
jgi:crossover junction endodeoxyribonuclease RusA